ncbi:MAG: threonine synthase [Clostridia bacterium]|nr:threonine synthase [Clostridia bacterium]
MKYVSTRDTSAAPLSVTAAEAIKKGLAPDGGLYIPVDVPKLTHGDVELLLDMTYAERAAYILSMFLDDYDKDALAADCRTAYGEDRFPGGAAPLHKIDGKDYSLELWHGPTCAFKDMALQIMPRLLSRALKMTGEEKTAYILVATSGDTGKAALEGYRDVEGVKMAVFYPDEGVSPMQKRQMATQEGSNVYVTAVEGNFDDAQSGVKAIFGDSDLAARANEAGFFFSSANSINWGRLVPQIVYYISAYCDLVKSGEIYNGEEILICVPTGNFGNIFAAYMAREMGLPLARLICASNANNVLTDFIGTGVYDRTREFHKTMSPSMDILISSNLERLLYWLCGPAVTADLMSALSREGKYSLPEEIMEKLRTVFSGYWLSEEETAAVIRDTFADDKYLVDTHTAVGLGCLRRYRAESGDCRKAVLASTASPYKFAADVCVSLGIPAEDGDIAELLNTLSAATGTEIPAPLAAVLTKEVRFTDVVKPADMARVPFEH